MSYKYDLQYLEPHIKIEFNTYKRGYDVDRITYEIKSPSPNKWYQFKKSPYSCTGNTLYHHSTGGGHDAGDAFHETGFFLEDLFKIDLDNEDEVKKYCLLRLRHPCNDIKILCKKILEGYKIWWLT